MGRPMHPDMVGQMLAGGGVYQQNQPGHMNGYPSPLESNYSGSMLPTLDSGFMPPLGVRSHLPLEGSHMRSFNGIGGPSDMHSWTSTPSIISEGSDPIDPFFRQRERSLVRATPNAM